MIHTLHFYGMLLRCSNVCSLEKRNMLLFALQLPGICGRLEFPDGSKIARCKNFYYRNKDGDLCVHDRAMYDYWMESHEFDFRGWLRTDTDYGISELSKDLYRLRCFLTHEGIIPVSRSRLIVVEDYNTSSSDESFLFYGPRCVGDYSFLSIDDICRKFFSIAVSVFREFGKSDYKSEIVGLDFDIYKGLLVSLQSDVNVFWSSRTNEDSFLYDVVYRHLFLHDFYRFNRVKEHFEQHPFEEYRDNEFPIDVYNVVVGSDVYKEFFPKFFDEIFSDDGDLSNVVFHFDKTSFDRMMSVWRDFYSSSKRLAPKIEKCVDSGHV